MESVNNILDKFGAQVSKLAKINVGSSKNPNGGKKIDSSGALRKSIGYKLNKTSKGYSLTFEMEDYGVLRDAGQLGKNRRILKGWNKSVFIPRGKGFTNKYPKVNAIDKWIKDKPIRLRDLKTGSFVQVTPNKIKSLSFLIGRKIFLKGIQPGLFFSDAWDRTYKNLPDEITEAFNTDIDNIFDGNISK